MQHSNAKLTPAGRRRLVSLEIDDGLSLEQAALHSGVSKTTAWEWTSRWRAACASDQDSWACLQDRSSRPHCSPARTRRRAEDAIVCVRRCTGWGPRLIAGQVGGGPFHRPPRARPPRPVATPTSRPHGCGALRVAMPWRSPADGHETLRPVRSSRPCPHPRPNREITRRRIQLRPRHHRRGWSPVVGPGVMRVVCLNHGLLAPLAGGRVEGWWPPSEA